MTVTKVQKIEILNDLKDKFSKAKSIWFASTNTLTVSNFFKLRADLREVNSTYTIAKKTLIRKALKDTLDINIDLATFPGQIWVVCSNKDAVAGLGKVNDFMKNFKKEEIIWASLIFEWELKTLDDTKIIAAMPSKDILLGRLVGSMQSPLSSLARFFDAASKDLETAWKSKVSDLKWNKTEEKIVVEEAISE